LPFSRRGGGSENEREKLQKHVEKWSELQPSAPGEDTKDSQVHLLLLRLLRSIRKLDSVKDFFGHLHFFYFCYNESELGARIDPGMALTQFPSRILDEMRFKPTIFGS